MGSYVDVISCCLPNGSHISHRLQVLYLGNKGGDTVGETVRRVMASTMRSSVGQLFNMHGAQRHGKEGFSNKKLFEVVCSKYPYVSFVPFLLGAAGFASVVCDYDSDLNKTSPTLDITGESCRLLLRTRPRTAICHVLLVLHQ